jgi:hypothetical protein
LVEADGLPVVQECGAYLSVKPGRSSVPIKNIEHNSEAVGFFRYSRNMRQQRSPHTLPTKPWSDEEVFQEGAVALKRRITIEK